jgi:predicted transcriptional regulator
VSNKLIDAIATQSKTTNIIKNEKMENDFEPSMKTLLRIMDAMLNNNSEGKTCLARDTNLNYARLAKHVAWLEQKGLVESIIHDQKINVVLTQKGRTFGTTIIT